jgi:hypothetical protein
MSNDLLRCYYILDLNPTATLEQVRAAYHDLIKVWHPDRYQNEAPRLRARAEEKLKAITGAYTKITAALEPSEGGDPLPMDFGERWGFVDQRGQTVIYPDFLAIHPFQEGLAAVRPVDKWGYVDRSGTFRVTPLYEECGDFAEGMAAVKWYGRWGYIDREGQFIIQPRFQHAESFENGRARVRIGARWGMVNRMGDVDFDTPLGNPQLAESVER